jgi:hypothetical protein
MRCYYHEAAMLAWTTSRLVPVASLEVAPIDDEKLRVLAGSDVKLALLRRGCG